MIPVSQFLKLTRLAMEHAAQAGRPIEPDTAVAVCSLLQLCEAHTFSMETRLGGFASFPDLAADTKVVSIADFLPKPLT